jgi:hypothetical protein
MTFLVWRQHRSQLLFATVALAMLAAVLVPSGVHLASAYASARRTCAISGTCGSLGNGLFRNYGVLFDIVGLTATVPALFGLFWGAPLIASEIEAGTTQLAWTQTVTRRRWLAVKAAWMLAAAALWGAAIAALVTWWSGPVNAVYQSRFDLGHFDTQGLVPIGYSVFAVALGITAGLLVRRVLPALAVTLGIFTGLRFAVDYGLRGRYLSPVVKSLPLGSHTPVSNGSYWMIGTWILDSAGKVPARAQLTGTGLPAACRGLAGHASLTQCLGAHGWRAVVAFQPADRFWTFQLFETALYLVLAAALLYVAFRCVVRHDA